MLGGVAVGRARTVGHGSKPTGGGWVKGEGVGV